MKISEFFLPILKPYKWHYAVMMAAPFANAVYPIMYNYAVKLLIDLFTNDAYITFSDASKPIMYFIMAQIILDCAWRAHNFAQLKSMPYIFQGIMDRVCRHCFNLPYAYFQNNLAGSIIGKVRGIGDNYFKLHQSLEYQLSSPLLIMLFSGITLAFINFQIFLFVSCFTAIYSPLALKFFSRLARMEQAKQDSWYHIFGAVADRITNIFTIFAFAKKQRELKTINDYYDNIHNPLVIKYYKYDIIASIILGLLYWVFLISLFCYVIHLRNNGSISIGDIAFIMSLTFLFTEKSWNTVMEIKDFLEDLAALKAAFSIMQVSTCKLDKPNSKELIIRI